MVALFLAASVVARVSGTSELLLETVLMFFLMFLLMFDAVHAVDAFLLVHFSMRPVRPDKHVCTNKAAMWQPFVRRQLESKRLLWSKKNFVSNFHCLTGGHCSAKLSLSLWTNKSACYIQLTIFNYLLGSWTRPIYFRQRYTLFTLH